MNKSSLGIGVAALSVLALAACGKSADPQTPSAAESPIAPAAATAPVSTVFWADKLKSCDGAQVTTIHWGKEAVAAGPASVLIGDGPSAGVFAKIGGEGSKESGPWAAPGLVMVLKGEADGVERARLTMQGPADCL